MPKYHLEVQITVRPAHPDGGPYYSGNERLQLSDTFTLGDRSLREMTGVMADLDELLHSIGVREVAP